MLFNSYIFILCFLPVTVLGYYLCNKRSAVLAKVFLLGMSLWFYGYNNPWYLILILGSITVNFTISKLLDNTGDNSKRKLYLVIGILFNVGLIFYFKYYDFFVENLNGVFQTDFVLKNIALPLGISFFTFQQLSYIIDSYRGETADYSFLEYALFVSFFPQLVAGPIVLHSEMIPQLRDKKKRRVNYDNLAKGIMLFAVGITKKVLIADYLGKGVTWGFADVRALQEGDVVIVMLAYTLQIYFDFSGYSDMATGIALMFNIDLPMNFDSPYKAKSIPEFWRRWHLTLTRFLRTYIYFPLGGSRKGVVRTYLNIMVVFLVSGIWHGANWTFILWGILHGIGNCIGRFIDKICPWICKKEEGFHPLLMIRDVCRWFVTFGFVNVCWLLFRADSVADWRWLLGRLYWQFYWHDSFDLTPELADLYRIPGIRSILGRLGIPYTELGASILSMVIIFVLATGICLFTENSIRREYKTNKKNMIITLVLLFACIFSMSSVSVFLYFNF